MSHSMSDRLSEWVSEWVGEGVEYCLWRPCRTQIHMSAGTHAQLACTNTPAQTYLLACACARTCTLPHTRTRTCTHTNSLYLTLIFVYICMHCIHKDACVNVCVRTYIYLYADIYLYIYMRAGVYICTHSHMYVSDRMQRQKVRESHSERERGHTCEGMCASGCACNGACVRSCVCVWMQTLHFWSLEILQIVTNDHIYIHACVHICKGMYTWVCTRLHF